MDEIARGHVVLLPERLLDSDDLIEADVGVVRRFDVSKSHDGAVGTVSATTGVSREKNIEDIGVRTRIDRGRSS